MSACEHPLGEVERYVVDRVHRVFRCRCRLCNRAWLERGED